MTGLCSVEGCSKPIHGKGLCRMHESRVERTGKVGPAGPLVRRYQTVTCAAADCDAARGKGSAYCAKHRARVERHGDPSIVLPHASLPAERNPNWSTTPTYTGLHHRIRRALGSASEHTCLCGVPATSWAWQPGGEEQYDPNHSSPFSTRAEDYAPRCWQCHVTQDRTWRKERAS